MPFQPEVATALWGSREAQNALISLTPRMKRKGFNQNRGRSRSSGDERGYIYKMDHELARVVLRLWDESSS